MSLTRPLVVLLALTSACVASMRPTRAWAQSCTAAAVPVAFGNYSPSSFSPDDSVGSISITCQGVVSLLVTLSVGLSAGNSGNYAARYMTSASGNLDYQVYTTAARTQIWGDGTAGTGKVSTAYLLQALVPVTLSMSVYGRIPARQNAKPDTYADTLMVTVNY